MTLASAYDKKKFASNGGFSDPLTANTQKPASQPIDDPYSTNWMEFFDVAKCEVIDFCKPCSFKELQKWPECQATGLRLIK